MENLRSSSHSETRGYLSKRNKEKFTRTAGILAAVFIIGQSVLPFAILFITALSTSTLIESMLDNLNIHDAVYWHNSIWMTDEYHPFGLGNLKKINPEKGGEIKEVRLTYDFGTGQLNEDDTEIENDLHMRGITLLPDNDRLWLISSSRTGIYQEGHNVKMIATRNLGDFCNPFLYNGKPTVVEQRPDGLFRLVFENENWQKTEPIEILNPEREIDIKNNLQILAEDSILHIFVRQGNTIFYQYRSVNQGIESGNEWKVVCKTDNSWKAFSNNGELSIFATDYLRSRRKITGFKNTGDEWELFFSHSVPPTRDIGAFYFKETNNIGLLYKTFRGSYKLIEIDGTKIVNETKYGSDLFYPGKIFYITYSRYALSIILPFILAIILTRLMRKHRVCIHSSDYTTMAYASLTKRALAQLIDIVVVGWPYIIGIILMMFAFLDIYNLVASTFFSFSGFMIFALLWALLFLFIYSATEGKYGVTLGKLIMRIRVFGTDLKPCGFGRAFIRNILKLVDGFFNFTIGIIIAALSENWQRIGDMAARTVVVDARTKTEHKKEDHSKQWQNFVQKLKQENIK